jgi:ribonuclease HII
MNADIALIDGNIKYNLPIKSISVIGGDKKSLTIAAASIMAKVVRDKYMLDLSTKYPEYAWHKNFGYGTKEHLAAISLHGICKHHRKSFSPIKDLC